MSDITREYRNDDSNIYRPCPKMGAMILQDILELTLLGEYSDIEAEYGLRTVWLANNEYSIHQDEQSGLFKSRSLQFIKSIGSLGIDETQPVVTIKNGKEIVKINPRLDVETLVPAFSISVPGKL